MTETFETVNDAHLDDLLKRTVTSLAEKTPIGYRSAAMFLVDYYQAILKEAAAKVGVDLQGTAIPTRISQVRSSIGGLQIDYLEGLEQIRNTVFHYEDRIPDPRALQMYLDRARRTRDMLLKAADTAIAEEKVMARNKQRLKASGMELKRLVPSLGSELAQRRWTEKANRAVQSGTDIKTPFNQQDLDLYVELREEIVTLRTAEEVLGLTEEPPPEYEPPEDYWPEEPPEQEPPEPEFDPGDFYPEEPEDQDLPDESPDDWPPGDTTVDDEERQRNSRKKAESPGDGSTDGSG